MREISWNSSPLVQLSLHPISAEAVHRYFSRQDDLTSVNGIARIGCKAYWTGDNGLPYRMLRLLTTQLR